MSLVGVTGEAEVNQQAVQEQTECFFNCSVFRLVRHFRDSAIGPQFKGVPGLWLIAWLGNQQPRWSKYRSVNDSPKQRHWQLSSCHHVGHNIGGRPRWYKALSGDLHEVGDSIQDASKGRLIQGADNRPPLIVSDNLNQQMPPLEHGWRAVASYQDFPSFIRYIPEMAVADHNHRQAAIFHCCAPVYRETQLLRQFLGYLVVARCHFPSLSFNSLTRATMSPPVEQAP